MSARTETIAHLTCDNCGKQRTGPGLVGWWQLDQHPDGIDTAPFNQPRPPFDLCSWGCVSSFAWIRTSNSASAIVKPPAK